MTLLWTATCNYRTIAGQYALYQVDTNCYLVKHDDNNIKYHSYTITLLVAACTLPWSFPKLELLSEDSPITTFSSESDVQGLVLSLNFFPFGELFGLENTAFNSSSSLLLLLEPSASFCLQKKKMQKHWSKQLISKTIKLTLKLDWLWYYQFTIFGCICRNSFQYLPVWVLQLLIVNYYG